MARTAETYRAAAATAFREEVVARPGKAGLLFLGGAGEAEVVGGGSATQTDAVWVEPLQSSDAVALGLVHGLVFLLSSMQWDGLQPGVAEAPPSSCSVQCISLRYSLPPHTPPTHSSVFPRNGYSDPFP